MSASDPVVRSTPAPFDLSFFAHSPKAESSKILQHLISNPFYQFVVKGGQPSPSQMLLLASAVVAALDKKVDDLKQENVWWRTLLTRPLFVRSTEKAPANDANGGGNTADGVPPTSIENDWFKKYLTLGNLLASLIVSLGILGGVLTYFTANEKARAEAAEQRVRDLQQDIHTSQELATKYRLEMIEASTKADNARKDVAAKSEELRRAYVEQTRKTAELGEAKKLTSQQAATIQTLTSTNARLQAALNAATTPLTAPAQKP